MNAPHEQPSSFAHEHTDIPAGIAIAQWRHHHPTRKRRRRTGGWSSLLALALLWCSSWAILTWAADSLLRDGLL